MHTVRHVGILLTMSNSEQQFLTLKEAARYCPGSRSPHTDTVSRWIKKGVRGVKLRALFVGQWVTTPEWLDDFLEARTAARLPSGIHENASAERTAAARAAMARDWGI